MELCLQDECGCLDENFGVLVVGLSVQGLRPASFVLRDSWCLSIEQEWGTD